MKQVRITAKTRPVHHNHHKRTRSSLELRLEERREHALRRNLRGYSYAAGGLEVESGYPLEGLK